LASLNLNIFARHADRIRMTNVAQMVNVLQAMILTDKEKMLLTPTYYVYKMYVPFQGAQSVPVSFDPGEYKFQNISLPQADAIAARASDGKVWIAVTNIDPVRSVDMTLKLEGIAASRAVGEILTAPRVDSVNTFETPGTVVPKHFAAQAVGGRLVLKLPAKSVAIVQLDE
jgi:alpha-N-arabinofuranosidase